MKLSKNEIRKKFNNFAKYYDIIEFAMSLILNRYRKKLLKKAYGKVLELGVGTGANLKYYPKQCKITGIELSNEMLKKARKKARKLGINAEFIIGDSEKLPFRKKGFDTIVDTLCLCTYQNSIKALKEMKRVCKKNGRILLIEHGISNNKILRKLQYWREPKHYQNLGCSLIRNPEELVRKAGLRIDKVERKLFGIIYVIEARH